MSQSFLLAAICSLRAQRRSAQSWCGVGTARHLLVMPKHSLVEAQDPGLPIVVLLGRASAEEKRVSIVRLEAWDCCTFLPRTSRFESP